METARQELPADRQALLDKLRTDILLMQGFITPKEGAPLVNMGRLTEAFPHGVFPTGAIHEFITSSAENAAATSAFATAIAASLSGKTRPCIWIYKNKLVFPPSLIGYGVNPEQVIFVKVRGEKEGLWATEEALKAPGIAAVIAELPDLDLTASRRQLLAVEKSGVTGLVLRHRPRYLDVTAAAARWQVVPARSRPPRRGMPGIGYPAWMVSLDMVKNGRNNTCQLEWIAGRFQETPHAVRLSAPAVVHRQAG
jgi:protein ImuA